MMMAHEAMEAINNSSMTALTTRLASKIRLISDRSLVMPRPRRELTPFRKAAGSRRGFPFLESTQATSARAWHSGPPPPGARWMPCSNTKRTALNSVTSALTSSMSSSFAGTLNRTSMRESTRAIFAVSRSSL